MFSALDFLPHFPMDFAGLAACAASLSLSAFHPGSGFAFHSMLDCCCGVGVLCLLVRVPPSLFLFPMLLRGAGAMPMFPRTAAERTKAAQKSQASSSAWPACDARHPTKAGEAVGPIHHLGH